MALKISGTAICIGHLRSVFYKSNGNISFLDIVMFGFFPLLIAYALASEVESLSGDVFNAAIAVFSIFGALLLSVQIALFGIVQRERDAESRGAKSKFMNEERVSERRKLIKELNVNVSFLIYFSVSFLSAFICFIVLRIPDYVEVFTFGYALTFFSLNMMMVVKRAYVLFDQEYS